jgi:hypothetical protein
MARQKRQTNPSPDEGERPIIAVGSIHGANVYAPAGEHARNVLQVNASRRNNERLACEFFEAHSLPPGEPVILSNSQHVGHFEESPVRIPRFAAIEDCKGSVEIVFGRLSSELITWARRATITVDDLNRSIRVRALKRTKQIGNAAG